MGVPQVMEADAGQGTIGRQEPNPLLAEAMRAQRRAIRLRHKEIVVRQPPADL
jgi:hypothetical protein